ncbi:MULTISPECIES: hypothetical protein [unclassified Burkholderia]|uniref:hypothetical protein n=1 Tax=unclassified Burkholderia TaxID=2613784 RepID=UPI0021AB60CB|nr:MULTISPECIES: hypothetical protein [unclassified Burkholderia]
MRAARAAREPVAYTLGAASQARGAPVRPDMDTRMNLSLQDVAWHRSVGSSSRSTSPVSGSR